jgi:hypothetical protein
MPLSKTMTFDEKCTVMMKAIELEKEGKKAESEKAMKSIPLPPYLAKIIKEKVGADFFERQKWNLSEADAEYGPGWLSK